MKSIAGSAYPSSASGHFINTAESFRLDLRGLASPVIDHIEVVTRGDVRRAKLYLRELHGRRPRSRRSAPTDALGPRPTLHEPGSASCRPGLVATTGNSIVEPARVSPSGPWRGAAQGAGCATLEGARTEERCALSRKTRMTSENAIMTAGADELIRRRSRSGRRRRGFWALVRDIVVILVVAVLVSFVIKTFLVRSFYIPSGSMEQTLMVKDRILVDELTSRFSGYDRGDVVVFRDPGGWLPVTTTPDRGPLVESFDWLMSLVGISTPDSEDHLIKRIIGVARRTMSCAAISSARSRSTAPRSTRRLTSISPRGRHLEVVPYDVTVPQGSLWTARRQPRSLPRLALQHGPALARIRAARQRRGPRLPHHLAALAVRADRHASRRLRAAGQ